MHKYKIYKILLNIPKLILQLHINIIISLYHRYFTISKNMNSYLSKISFILLTNCPFNNLSECFLFTVLEIKSLLIL